MKRKLLWMIPVLLLLPAAAPLHAQYFGQNQVVYNNPQFKVLKTEHFDIYYYPDEHPAVEQAALMAERWYARLSRLLNHELSDRQALILYGNGPRFRESNVLGGSTGEGTGGVTEILKRRIVLPFAGPLAETDHVLGHELVHAFQFDMTGLGGGRVRAGLPSVSGYPLWFVEGMAEYLSLGPVDPNTAMWMRDAVASGLPDLAHLQDSRFFPYRYGQAVWAFIGGKWGDEAIGKILKAARGTNLRPAFTRVLGVSADSVIKMWQQETRREYEPIAEMTHKADDYGRLILEPGEKDRSVNIAPALSPDGTQLVFLSSRDLFSIDMYLADIKTGRVTKRLTRTDTDPHFESIEFINSAGAWSPDGQRFAFGGVEAGKPVLTILNVDRDKREREIEFPDLGEIFNPTWSPDGRYVAFSALAGGLTDLFVYDLKESRLDRKTNDDFAELQPAWSPDGRSIAFVTDRFTTTINNLAYGDYRIALLDVGSGKISQAWTSESGRQVNPQWAPNGRQLYFVSDRNGIANVYLIDLTNQSLRQVTNLYTGVSGITALSPSISVSGDSGTVAMTVYGEGGYHLYMVEDSTVLEGQAVQPMFAAGDPSILPPVQREPSEVMALRSSPFFGLPPDTTDFTEHRYHPTLGLDYIGQPSFIVGHDQFGTFVGAGGSVYFSDMLGNHHLGAAFQINGGVKDISAALSYANLRHRANWGFTVQQIPYRTGAVYWDSATVQGQPTLVEQTVLYRQTNRQARVDLQYPFSRVRRLEASVGYSNVGFGIEDRRRFLDANGSVIYDTTLSVPAHAALNFATGSAALVYDNSILGFTGPILGTRYRLQAGAAYGSLKFETTLLDLRKYIMPRRPFTLAARTLFYGRLGPDAEDNVLQPLYLGSQGLIRGYTSGSFDFYTECVSSSSCPSYTNLFGSKMIVANLELRFPPLGVFGIGGPFGSLPIDMLAFADGGLAWFDSPATDRAFFLSGGERKPVFSTGVGLRGNLLGFMILELDLVHPFNRPGKGTYLQFGFTPGF
jgi:Tol biopolymer transport system component